MKKIIGIDIIPYLRLLLRKWWMIALMGLLGLTYGAREALELKPSYQAVATIAFDQDYVEKLYRKGRIMYASPKKHVTQAARVKAKYLHDYSGVLEPLVKRLSTEASAAPTQRAVSKKLHRLIEEKAGGGGESGYSAYEVKEALWGRTSYAPPLTIVPKFGVPHLLLSVAAPHKDMAKLGLDAYLEVLRDFHLREKRRQAENAMKWLKEEMELVREDLEQCREELVRFAERHGLELNRSIRTSATELLQWTKDRMTRVREQSNGLNSELTLLTNGGVTPETAATVRALKSELARLESELFKTVVSPTRSEAAVAARRKRVEALKARLAILEQDLRKADAERVETRAASAHEDLERGEAHTRNLAELAPQFQLMSMRLETTRTIYDMLFQEYEKAEQRAAAARSSLVILEPPAVGTDVPPRTAAIGKWLLGGLGCGMLMVLGINAGRRILRSEHLLDDYVDQLSLGVIPDVSRRGFRQDASDEYAVAFVAYGDPGHPYAEAVRNVQTALHDRYLRNGPGALLITSALPEEGKTIVAVSMAVALSMEEDKRAILVDGDLRRPRIHEVFGDAGPADGLSDIIVGKSAGFSKLVRPSRVRDLYYLTAGEAPADPMAVLRSDRFAKLLTALDEFFDYVIIDAPPILGMADALILSGYARGTILVAREGVVTRHEFLDALNKVERVTGSQLLGVVKNGRSFGLN